MSNERNAAEFASVLLSHTATIIEESGTGENIYSMEALRTALKQILANIPQSEEKRRNNEFKKITWELGQYFKRRYPDLADEFAPISKWSETKAPLTIARALRDSIPEISGIVGELTYPPMSEKEFDEHRNMARLTHFLTKQGLTVTIEPREDPESPLDFLGTVNGVRWAFELTRLSEGYSDYRKVGHPKDPKPIREQLERFAKPITQVPMDAPTLQQALDRAIEHGNQKNKLDALNGAKHCLVIHNAQFLYEPSWDEITWPDLGKIDVALILHEDDLMRVSVWEVIPPDGFGKPIHSRTVTDLADKAEAQARLKTSEPDGEYLNTWEFEEEWKPIEEIERRIFS